MINFDPNDPGFHANPYPTYRILRDEAPVYVIGDAFAAVTRYDDVAHVLRHPEIFSSSAINISVRDRPTKTVINTDPPRHTQLRSLVNRAFTPKMVADMEPRIREITRELIEPAITSGAMDVVADLAVPLPVTVIAEILGIPTERRDDFKRWSNAAILEDAAFDEEALARMRHDLEEGQDYFDEIIALRRRKPDGGLISLLVQAEVDGEALAPDDLLGFVVLLLIAGNETTTNLIGNMVLALLRHPDQMAALLANRSLIPNTVEEALRYDSPVQFLFRRTVGETEIAGVTLREGMEVVAVFASANRDERRFDDPDSFDIRRNTQGHLAFGHGIHFCLGAPLARLEARVALEELVTRTSNLRRVDEVPLQRVRSTFLRGLASLPVAFEPAVVGNETR